MIAWPCSSGLLSAKSKSEVETAVRTLRLTLHVDPLLLPELPRKLLHLLRETSLHILRRDYLDTSSSIPGLDGGYEGSTSSYILER